MVCVVVWRAMEEGSQLSEQLKVIFDLCDADRDGVIAVEDFRRIALEHFGKNQVGARWSRSHLGRRARLLGLWKCARERCISQVT